MELSNLTGEINSLSTFPNELLFEILSYLDYKSLITFGLISKHTYELISDPLLWCSTIIKTKRYDDYSFCFDFSDNDTISYNRNCLSSEDIAQILVDQHLKCVGCSDRKFGYNKHTFDYDIKIFNELWQYISEQDKKTIWKEISIDDYIEKLSDDANMLIDEIREKLKWSLDPPKLYRLLCSSLQGFYKVLITGTCWKETCRFERHNNICKSRTPIYSTFCTNCRLNLPPSVLLRHIVDIEGSFTEERDFYTCEECEDSDDDNEHFREFELYPFNEEKEVFIDINMALLFVFRNHNLLCIGQLIDGIPSQLTDDIILFLDQIDMPHDNTDVENVLLHELRNIELAEHPNFLNLPVIPNENIHIPMSTEDIQMPTIPFDVASNISSTIENELTVIIYNEEHQLYRDIKDGFIVKQVGEDVVAIGKDVINLTNMGLNNDTIQYLKVEDQILALSIGMKCDLLELDKIRNKEMVASEFVVLPFDKDRCLYRDPTYNFIVKEVDDKIVVIGRLVDDHIRTITDEEKVIAEKIGLSFY